MLPARLAGIYFFLLSCLPLPQPSRPVLLVPCLQAARKVEKVEVNYSRAAKQVGARGR